MTRVELLELIANSENSGVAFKRDDTQPLQLSMEVVAFANFRGGRILLGVDDGGNIRGIPRRDLKRWVMDKVFGCDDHPMIIPFYKGLQIDEECPIAEISVSQGATKPCVIVATKTFISGLGACPVWRRTTTRHDCMNLVACCTQNCCPFLEVDQPISVRKG